MSEAIVVRDKDGKLLCFGPNDKNYSIEELDPGQVRSVEDYDKVVAEYKANLPIPPTEEEKFAAQVASAVELIKKDATLVAALKEIVGAK